jgi:hypothetical protein
MPFFGQTLYIFKGAHEDVRIATERGLKIYYKIDDVPNAE